MSIIAKCPGCEKRLKAKNELAGKRVKCPGCGRPFLVPGYQPGAVPPATVATSPREPDFPTPFGPVISLGRRERRDRRPLLLVGGVVALCLLAAGGVILVLQGKDRPPGGNRAEALTTDKAPPRAEPKPPEPPARPRPKTELRPEAEPKPEPRAEPKPTEPPAKAEPKPPEPPANPADSKEMDRLLDELVSELIVTNYFKDYKGSAIDVFAARVDWPLSWRLGAVYMAVPGNNLIVNNPAFKGLLEAKLKAEVVINQSMLKTLGFFESHVKSKALLAEARSRVAGAREARVKAEITISGAITPEKAANIARVINTLDLLELDLANANELRASRAALKDAMRKALNADSVSLKLLLQARADADTAAPENLRQVRLRLTNVILEQVFK